MDSIVKYFDLVTRSWRASRTPCSVSIPRLDGQLSATLSDLQAASSDWGHIVFERPSAVLFPASIEDIVKMVRFCGSIGVKIGARGQAHTMYGQSQVSKGVIVHMAALNSIDSIESDHAIVEAGVIWRDFLTATLARGLTPPILTDYLSLSIGGTLSVGGVNGSSYEHGAQVDNVIDLDVVTGVGDLVTCSVERHRDLFEATLAGLGQCAIIVRANVKLIPAPRFTRVFDMAYQDLNTLLEDFQKVLADDRFNYVQGILSSSATKDRPKYILQGASYYDETPPYNDTILSNLRFLSRNVQTTEVTYFKFCDRVSKKEASLRQCNRWNLPHPWFDMFIPASQAASYIGTVEARLESNDHPDFANLLYGFRKRALTRPLLRVPEEEVFFLFNISRTTHPAQISAAITQNRQFYDEGCVKGGVCYPIGAITMSRDDWKNHFGLEYELLLRSKARYDPNRILTPGPRMFN